MNIQNYWATFFYVTQILLKNETWTFDLITIDVRMFVSIHVSCIVLQVLFSYRIFQNNSLISLPDDFLQDSPNVVNLWVVKTMSPK